MKKKKVIMYADERGYTLIEKNKPIAKLKELDMGDLKLWKKDEMKFSNGN